MVKVGVYMQYFTTIIPSTIIFITTSLNTWFRPIFWNRTICLNHGGPQEFLLGGGGNILGGNLKFMARGLTRGLKNRTAKSVNILICLKFVKVIFMIS